MNERPMASMDEMLRTVVQFWGDQLARWPQDVVARMGLSDADAECLRAIGLPSGVEWTLVISPPEPGETPAMEGGCPVLARDGSVVPICVDPRGNRVFAVEGDVHRFVNSDVSRFGAFLMLLQRYRVRVQGLDEEAAQTLIDETETRMAETDPAAMADREAYWPVVVEQMRDGLL